MKIPARLAGAVVLAAAVVSCKLFDYSGVVSHKYAFVYGVTNYSLAGTTGDPNLTYPDQDASAVAALLTARGYAVTSRWVDGTGEIFVNGSDTHTTIGQPQYSSLGAFLDPGFTPGSAPTRDVILFDLASMASSVGKNDVVLVYFSGHGTQDTSVSPAREYFVPYQGVSYFNGGSSPGFYADVQSSPLRCVRDDDLASVFEMYKTPRKVVVLDTCNSGGFIGNQLESDWTPPSGSGGLDWVSPGTLAEAISNYASMSKSSTGLSPYGATVLSAAGRDELSYETDTWKHGVMTYWLLQGLAGPADLNKDGSITALEAFAYAKAGVDQNWNAANPVASDGTSASFEPHVSGGPVDFVLY